MERVELKKGIFFSLLLHSSVYLKSWQVFEFDQFQEKKSKYVLVELIRSLDFLKDDDEQYELKKMSS